MVNVLIGFNPTKLSSLDWKEGQGSSLSVSSHQVLNSGFILCVDKSPAKVKFFKKKDGVVKSICCIADKPTHVIVSELFGQETTLHKVGDLVLV